MSYKPTQAEQLFSYIRKHGACSTKQLLMTGISTCPWKRIAEGAGRHLGKTEKIVKEVNCRGHVTYSINRCRT